MNANNITFATTKKPILPQYFVPTALERKEPSVPKDVLDRLLVKELAPADALDLSCKQLMEVGNFSSYGARFVYETRRLRCPELSTPLKHHQWKVVAWMKLMEEERYDGMRGGIVSAEMGLGKTCIALFHSLSAPRGKWPTLIICNKALAQEQWPSEVSKFFGDRVKVLVFTRYHLGRGFDKVTAEDVYKYDIVITTYDTCKMSYLDGANKKNKKRSKYMDEVQVLGEEGIHLDKVIGRNMREKRHCLLSGKWLPNLSGSKLLYEVPWNRMICDEVKKFTNPKSSMYEAMLGICAKYRWCLTGTPIYNRPDDGWAQLRVCGYDRITTPKEWCKQWTELWQGELKERTLFMTKADAGIQLPPLETKIVAVKLQQNEKTIYKEALTRARQTLVDVLAGRISFIRLQAIVTCLRKICISSHLSVCRAGEHGSSTLQEEVLSSDKFGELDVWVTDRQGDAGLFSSKLNAVIEIIKGVPEGEKVIVFSSLVMGLELLKERLDVEGIDYAMITGQTKDAARKLQLQSFKNDSNVNVLGLTYLVGAEGFNLTQANHIVFLEPWWNEAVHEQAQARAWRMGQTRPVTVYRMCCTGTVEMQLQKMCERKKSVENRYRDVDAEMRPSDYGAMSVDVLKKILSKEQE